MSKRGFVQLEFLLALILATNLFVILTNILYNMNEHVENKVEHELTFGAFLSKVESDLWKVEEKDLIVNTDSIIYFDGSTRYTYYVKDQYLIMAIGPYKQEIPYPWMQGIYSISFLKEHKRIRVTYVDDGGEHDAIIFY